MEQLRTKDFQDVPPDIEKEPRRLSFKEIQEYLTCPSCYFGRRLRKELDKPPKKDILEIGTFLAGVIASAHSPRKRGLKFGSTRALIGFANYKYTETLLGREKEETERFLGSLSKNQKETINHLLASYFEDNEGAKVLSSEKVVEGFLGEGLVWGRIDQLREEEDLGGSKVLEVVEMKFNQEPNIQNCFQLGVYTSLLSQDPKIQLPIRQVIYDLLDRRRFILQPKNSNLINEVISAVRLAISARYDEEDGRHVHFPQKASLGGTEGKRAQFPKWQELTKPPRWNMGRGLFSEARERLMEYFKTVSWQVENLRENR